MISVEMCIGFYNYILVSIYCLNDFNIKGIFVSLCKNIILFLDNIVYMRDPPDS